MKQYSDLCSHSDYDEKLKKQINIAFGQWFPKDYTSDAKKVILTDLNTHIGIISFNVERNFLFH